MRNTLIRLHGIKAMFGSREFSGFWVLFLTIWNSNLLRFFWSGLRHHRPREERILVSGAWECLRPLTFRRFPSDVRSTVEGSQRFIDDCGIVVAFFTDPATLSRFLFAPFSVNAVFTSAGTLSPPHRKLSTAPFLIGSTVFVLKSTPENKQSPSSEIIESPDLPVLASVPIVCG